MPGEMLRAAVSSAGPCLRLQLGRRTRSKGSGGRSPRSGGIHRYRKSSDRESSTFILTTPHHASADRNTISAAHALGALSASNPSRSSPKVKASVRRGWLDWLMASLNCLQSSVDLRPSFQQRDLAVLIEVKVVPRGATLRGVSRERISCKPTITRCEARRWHAVRDIEQRFRENLVRHHNQRRLEVQTVLGEQNAADV